MLENKTILITGGTGSLGTALTKRLLKSKVGTIRIFSRDEWKQTKMFEELDDSRLRFFIGDIRDKERLSRAVEGVDYVFHAAALKQVPIAEYNPFEAIKTNVYGTQNLVDVCLDNNVKKVVAIGTDKAASPANTYGATKLLMEKIIISANFFKGIHKTSFVCVRYGNVLGSRGSVLPRFIEQISNKGVITLTDPKMTRFTITMNGAIDLVLRALKNGNGGELFVPRLKSYTLEELKNAIIELSGKKVKIKKISLRPGEKFHETLISGDEISQTYESKEDYIIFQQSIDKISSLKKLKYKKTKLKSAYISNKNNFISKNQLKKMIREEGYF
ncbi:SDR family NAD(P)-dependent oxidoreductase [Nitrosopumilus maritimus]|uniref:Polysaccharide biosynthesis protein CapD n=1 Tax=Nitrosopumilus maritimus (strain SCM1) TaxID=436308 RepID=A9A1S5_NITMS|nr:SDR family NAD(P)-dependent oxidoreductase [Nitrosopumilus maritimus]ABX12046.1 polysaccharide biosynthesis protein CapD [Nitrosopumilus maritimus SCM1]